MRQIQDRALEKNTTYFSIFLANKDVFVNMLSSNNLKGKTNITLGVDRTYKAFIQNVLQVAEKYPG